MNIAGLEKAVKLDHRIALYVPGTNGVSEAADNAETVAAVAGMLSELFGGASAQAVRGYWKSAAGDLVEEKTVVVYANCTGEQLKKSGAAIVAAAEEIKRDLRQEAVSVEIDGTLYLI